MGLPFVFIISLILAAIIVIFVIYTIGHFSCQQELISINLFVADLNSEVEKTYYRTIDSQTIFKGLLPLPNGCTSIEKICFGFPDRSDFTETGTTEGREISLYSGQNKQLFFYPREGLQKAGVQQAHNIGLLNISIGNNPYCIQNTGDIELLLKNNGDYVLIE